MSALAGWGFTSPEALERFVQGIAPPPAVDRTQARWITPARLQAYAETLTETPKHWEVMQEFHCCYASALKHRRKIADIIGRRGSREP